MTPIKVVCGIIWKDNKVFIARRKSNKSLGGYWEFPGGKLEQDEDPGSALTRELSEEFEMTISNPKFLGEHIHSYDFFTIHLIALTCDFINSTFRLTDHDAYEFVSLNDLSLYLLAPADQHFAIILGSE